METPFHSILADNDFSLLNKIVNKFQFKNDKLPFDENNLEKIKDMFAFVLENVYSYDTSTMKNSYCILSNECWENEIDIVTSNNINLITELLKKIISSISEELKSHKELLLPH